MPYESASSCSRVAAALLGTGASAAGYGDLGRTLGPTLLVPVLLSVGVAMGYGARWAGGCTSSSPRS